MRAERVSPARPASEGRHTKWRLNLSPRFATEPRLHLSAKLGAGAGKSKESSDSDAGIGEQVADNAIVKLEDAEWAKRLEIGRLVSDVFMFLLPFSLLAAVVATHISPVVTPGFAEPQRVLESSASFIILVPVLFVSAIALYIECVAEPAVPSCFACKAWGGVRASCASAP